MYDSDELRALAVAARSGDDSPRLDLRQAMSPETVLALLDEIEALRKDAERYAHCREKLRWQLHRDRVMTVDEVDAYIDATMTHGGDACK